MRPVIRPTRPARDPERGVVLVLVALVMTVIMIVAALVIDMSLVRQNRQSDKSTADFAAAAGIRGLDNASGRPQPWKGVCAAIDYLMANNDEMATLTGTYKDGTGATLASDPCATPGDPPFTTLCDASKSSWALFDGTADGGRISVRIQSGYEMPDADFAEDSNPNYAGDLGDSANAGCDQLAVIIEEREGAYFGGAAGATGYESRVRSVARLVIENPGESTPALLLLERHDCEVLFIGGGSGARVIVEGVGLSPGLMHADSIGDGANCNPADIQDGNIFQVDSNPPDPRIIARRSPFPVGGETPGIISTPALSEIEGGVPEVASSPYPAEVCRQDLATDCGTTSPITGYGPVSGLVVGRGAIDRRYREHLIAVRNEAAGRFAWDDPTDLPPGWTEIPCSATGTFAEPQIWIDCDGGEYKPAANTSFAASVNEVVINGHVVVEGNGRLLQFVDVEKLYIRGSTSGAAVSLLGSNNNIRVNDGGLTDANSDGFVCDERYAASPTARSVVVIGSGPILAEGGSGKVLRMCQTMVFMMDSSGSTTCPVPSSDGVAPYDNTCRGYLRVGGSNSLDWSAPNINNVSDPTPAQLEHFEDLAFWSETEGGPGAIEGGGGVRLFGIFFTPNANPFRVGGNGIYDIEDAQFISRKLEVAGNATLVMRPQPQNAVQVPSIGGFTLVR